MNITVDKAMFRSTLDSFAPVSSVRERILALYSAALCLSDNDSMRKLIRIGSDSGLNRSDFYELVLQSYLFCGFPRMLEAAAILDTEFPLDNKDYDLQKVSEIESEDWFDRGMDLCRQVYKDKYEPLRKKIMGSAPEIFRWMIIEGYGKVLSRNGTDIITRELAVVAVLMMENRPKQLHSHILGALNVGCSRNLLKTVIEDIGPSAGDGYHTALEILDKVS